MCTGPITYQGQTAVQRDIATFKAALTGVKPEEAFIPAVAPGTIELQRRNDYYPTDEAYLFAIAEPCGEEYRAIVDAGFLLQTRRSQGGHPVWHAGTRPPALQTTGSLPSCGLEALNHALVGIPSDRVRYHLCWGSWHGPHVTDVPLKDIVDIVLRVRLTPTVWKPPIRAMNMSGRYGKTSNSLTARSSSRVWSPIRPTSSSTRN